MTNQEIMVYGAEWCRDCKVALRVLDEYQAQYRYVDVETDEEGMNYISRVNNGTRIVPTILFPDGSVMFEPSSAVLAQKLMEMKS